MPYVRFIFFVCLIGFPVLCAFGQDQKALRLLTERAGYSIRGLSVVNDSVLWVSGSKGVVGISGDGGKNWTWRTVEAAGCFDFRAIYAFDEQSAVVVSAGAPATIFLTVDQGRHWKKVYENRDERFFLDGVTFWNKKKGLVYGDPVDGRFVILQTIDGGWHWKALPFEDRPRARRGEASFAASGTAVFSLPPGYVWIGTGGAVARVLFSDNRGKTWKAYVTPVVQGKSSTGIFSLAFINKNEGICVGGDYRSSTLRKANAFLTTDGGKIWKQPAVRPWGYRSAVIYFTRDTLIATGKGGTDFSTDGGNNWNRLADSGFYVVQKARSGTAVYLAGDGGRVAKLTGFPHNSLRHPSRFDKIKE